MWPAWRFADARLMSEDSVICPDANFAVADFPSARSADVLNPVVNQAGVLRAVDIAADA